MNAELSLSENIKTPISKNLVIGKARYSINIRHFNEYQFACWHMHVCSVEVSVSKQRPGVEVRYCPQLFSTLFFEARSLSVPGVSLAIYSLGDPPLMSPESCDPRCHHVYPALTRVLGVLTLVLMLSRQPVHLLAHLPRPG